MIMKRNENLAVARVPLGSCATRSKACRLLLLLPKLTVYFYCTKSVPRVSAWFPARRLGSDWAYFFPFLSLFSFLLFACFLFFVFRVCGFFRSLFLSFWGSYWYCFDLFVRSCFLLLWLFFFLFFFVLCLFPHVSLLLLSKIKWIYFLLVLNFLLSLSHFPLYSRSPFSSSFITFLFS